MIPPLCLDCICQLIPLYTNNEKSDAITQKPKKFYKVLGVDRTRWELMELGRISEAQKHGSAA